MRPLDTLIAIAVAMIWGMGFVIAKAGMSHFSPILLMALRFTLTAVCMITSSALRQDFSNSSSGYR